MDAPGTILLSPADDQLAGSRLLVDQIRDTIASHEELDWGDIAILARRNQHLDEMQVQLITAGIPYVVRSGRDLVRTWTTALALLDLSTALRSRKVGEVTDYRAAISSYAWFPGSIRRDAVGQVEGLALDEVLLSLQPYVRDHGLRQFERAIDLLRKGRSVEDELDVIETRFLGYDAKPDKDAGEAPLALLRTILGRRSSTRAKDIDRLRGFIEKAQHSNTESGPRVELATFHGAKGRQWKLVILPWVSGTAVPDPLTRDAFGELEGERRLFYVAMTRASGTLVIGVPSAESKEWTSRFVYEAGILQRPPRDPVTPPVTAVTQKAKPPSRAKRTPAARRTAPR